MMGEILGPPCVVILVLSSIYLVCTFLHSRFKNKETKITPIQHLPDNNLEPFPNNSNGDIEIEDQESFIEEIVSKYSSYKEFITSKDFDEYFNYFNKNPKVLEEIKDKIAYKHSSFFKYKSVKY